MRRLYILTLLLIFMSGCGKQSDLDKNGYPQILKIGISTPATSGEDVNSAFRNIEPLRLYLEKKLGIPVRFISVNGYAPIVEAIKAKKIHIATLPPYPYLIARKTANVTALFTTGNAEGKERPYKSCILFRKSLGIKTIDDLKKKMKDLVIDFSDPSSTTCHIIPYLYLKENGIDPEKDFKKVFYSGNQLAAILALSSDKLDVACSMPEILSSIYMRDKNISPESFDIIEISKHIPQSPHCIRKDINPAFAEKVKNAYLDLRNTDTAAYNSVIGIYKKYLDINPDSFRYVSVDEKRFDDYESMIKDIKSLEIK